MLNYEVLKLKDFRNLWLAEVVAEFSNMFYRWMFLYVVDQITHDPFTVAITGVVGTIPFLIFGPYAGVIADRVDRKKVMLYSNISVTLLLCISGILVLWIKNPPIGMLYSMEFMFSTLATFFMPANGAARAMLVPKERLNEANGLSSATRSMMPLIGMGIAGGSLVIIQKTFPNLFFPVGIFITSGCYFGACYFVSKLPTLTTKASSDEDSHALKAYLEGIRYIKSQSVLKIILFIELLSHISISFYITAYVTLNREWFGGGFRTIAIMEILQAVCMIIGSIWISKLVIKKPSTPYLIATFIIAVGLFAMGYSQIFWIFAAINGILGLVVPFLDVPLTTYIQASVPNQFLGRVNSVQTMLTFGVLPIGMILSAPLLKWLGPGPAFMIMGCARMGAGAVGLFHKGFRRATMPSEDNFGNNTPHPA